MGACTTVRNCGRPLELQYRCRHVGDEQLGQLKYFLPIDVILLLEIRNAAEKVQREARASVLSFLKRRRPWIKSSALLLSGVKEPAHDKGNPEDNKSGGGSLLPSFSMQTAAFSKSPPQEKEPPQKGGQKETVWFYLLLAIRSISRAFPSWTKKVRKNHDMQIFFVDKPMQLV